LFDTTGNEGRPETTGASPVYDAGLKIGGCVLLLVVVCDPAGTLCEVMTGVRFLHGGMCEQR
jgi:hypothetical protein